MLIEFSVENFKSIKDEARLSLVAGPGKEHRDTHIITPEMNQGVRPTPLLRSAAIYGANAAGKSNLIEALQNMQRIILGPVGDSLPVKPFLFNPGTRNKPTIFEIVGIVDCMQFQYGFSATSEFIIQEWLYAWPRGRVQVWFERTGAAESEVVECKFGDKLTGNKKTWQSATRPNALLLSTAFNLNSKQLTPIFEWFKTKLHIGKFQAWTDGFSEKWYKDDCKKKEMIQFLRSADLAIDDLRFEKKDFPLEMLPDNIPSEVKNQMKEIYSSTKITNIYLKHNTRHGNPVDLKLEEESEGTQKIFGLAGPWRHTLDKGHMIVFDELNEHLHPKLVKFLVNLFHDFNTKDAQLIFSTHDTSILSEDVFRRDQIWFCERNLRQETRLFPLTEFKRPHRVENLARSYLTGRYGALPYVTTPENSQEVDL